MSARGIVALLALSEGFEKLAVIANGAILLVYVGCAAAAIELRRRNVRSDGTPFEIPGASAAPYLALVVIVWMLSSVAPREWLAILTVVGLALALYVLRRFRGAVS